jgi:RNA polymerase sigma factor (sigma-70 family)
VFYSCIFIRSNPLHVGETAATGYGRNPWPHEWSEEELARVRAVLHKLSALRVANAEDAEDLVQETLLTMAKKCPDIELRKGLLVWSLGILRNKVGNYYRRARRQSPVTEFDGHERTSDHLLPAVHSPEARIHHAELRSLVTGILAGLTRGEREAVQLLIAGLPTGEIAARLSPEPYQNVVNRLHRGRKKLVRELARFGYTPRNSMKKATGSRAHRRARAWGGS